VDSSYLDQKYGTTRLLFSEKSIIDLNLNNNSPTQLFLNEGDGRKGEGGLRTKGYFKWGCKIQRDNWYRFNCDEQLEKSIVLSIDEAESQLPLVTLVTVVLNGESLLEETIQSVISQTYPNIEYLIIDGGSTDRTLDIIRKYEHAINYWVSEKDGGIYEAMNKSMRVANGDWIFFIGADDRFCSKNTVEYSVSQMKKKDAIYYGNVILSNSGKIYGGKFNKYKLMQQNICHQSIFYPVTIYKNKNYDTQFKLLADYKYNIELAGDKVNFIYMPEVIVIFNEHGMSCNGDEKFNTNKLRLIRSSFGIFYYVIKLVRTYLAEIYKGTK
jgi:glycosyltransferase involved in cell wall biosynthesis